VSVGAIFVAGGLSRAEEVVEVTHAQELKKLSLEELLQQQITTASRKPQALSEVPAAVEVLSSEDIHRSGVRTIADALRLGTGIEVARANTGVWAISARGFNTTAPDKLQVFMDGRSLYTPLFSGVLWDVQDYLLDDIDRIEIIRGPNATLWGANAFSGVINVITKSAKDTQGVYLNAGAGNEEPGFGGVRYGGKLGEDTYYRAYAKFWNRDSMAFENGASADDSAVMGQTGFRIDSDLSAQNSLTAQGDLYDGRYGVKGSADTVVDGANLMTRFTRRLDEGSELQLQVYYDHTHRKVDRQFEEELHTIDFDGLYRREINNRNELMLGMNYRLYEDRVDNPNPTVFGFFPPEKSIQYLNGFLQYEFKIVPDALAVTVGSKFGHNDFSGFDYQPSARLAWNVATANTLWAGVSRAVRTPTRFDEDLQITVPGFVLTPQQDFQSEKVIAYELGWRARPAKHVSVDVAGYFNQYSDLRSQERESGPAGPITLRNKMHGEGYGAETAVEVDPLDWWRVRVSYTYLEKQIYPEIGSKDMTRGVGEGNDPHHFGNIRSSWDLPQNLFLDAVLRYTTALPDPHVPGYVELDLRLAWRPKPTLEFAISGLNLLHAQHPEFGAAGPTREEVQRSGYFEVTWSF
jgi:iron complex outermembrane receptor protein